MVARDLFRALPTIRAREERIERLSASLAASRAKVQRLERDLEEARAARADDEVGRVVAEREALERQLAELRVEAGRDLTAPSFLALHHQWKRSANVARRARVERPDARQGFARKLAIYRLAESHGVPVPRVLRVWESLDDVDLDALPDSFVLKSDVGSWGLGVRPLVRVGEDRYRGVTGTKVTRGDEVVQGLRKHEGNKHIRGPYFAEELLQTGDPEKLPVDVKVYAFYGEVGQVMLRDVDDYARREARQRYLSPDGTDLGPVRTDVQISDEIAVPERLDELVEAARVLSRAVPMPFIRVDLYDLPDGIRFGELTLHPGGKQLFVPSHDKLLGQQWEAAQLRLEQDLRDGRSFGLEHGSHPGLTPHGDTW